MATRRFGSAQDDLGWERNVWIAKPSAMSRGRGIQVFGDICSLLDHVGLTAPGAAMSATTKQAARDESHGSTRALCFGASKQSADGWVVQKYIERPLLIGGRKFDLRQWVLVTSVNPLVVWHYNECYCRLAIEKYDLQNKEKLTDQFTHLVNQSVSKHHADYGEDLSFIAENGCPVVQAMWSHREFVGWLEHQHGVGGTEAAGQSVFLDRIQPQLHKSVVSTLLAAQPKLGHRALSYEIFGFDFMIDSSLNVWVIEVNASPATDFSTSVTARYVPAAVTDSLKVVLDHADWSNAPRHLRGKEPDTGGWVCIHQGALASRPTGALSMKLDIKGVAISSIDGPVSVGQRAKQQRKKLNRRQRRQQQTAHAVTQLLAREPRASYQQTVTTRDEGTPRAARRVWNKVGGQATHTAGNSCSLEKHFHGYKSLQVSASPPSPVFSAAPAPKLPIDEVVHKPTQLNLERIDGLVTSSDNNWPKFGHAGSIQNNPQPAGNHGTNNLACVRQ
eukprot:COSAG02_NODE_11889_length_1634_cov_3.785343_1_plen_502_part_01